MRTIKDPKQKPDVVRKRVGVEECDEQELTDSQAPQKKRKSPKKKEDEVEDLNDSGSTVVDNHSDRLSEKGSIVGEDDKSDVSSVKSTPPKKRNYSVKNSKDVEKALEVNGDVNDHDKDGVEETEIPVKSKVKRLTKKQKEKSELENKCEDEPSSVAEVEDHPNEEKQVTTKTKAPRKKKADDKTQANYSNTNHRVLNESDEDKLSQKAGKAPPKKPGKKGKTAVVKESETDETPPADEAEKEEGKVKKQKITNRKRKINNDANEADNIETKKSSGKKKKASEIANNADDKMEKTLAPPKPKKPRKSKKQIEKEKAEQELKRQLEEQRSGHSNRSHKEEERPSDQPKLVSEQGETTQSEPTEKQSSELRTTEEQASELKVKKKRKPKKKIETKQQETSENEGNSAETFGKPAEIADADVALSIKPEDQKPSSELNCSKEDIKVLSSPEQSGNNKDNEDLIADVIKSHSSDSEVNHVMKPYDEDHEEDEEDEDTDRYGNLNSSFESEGSKFDLDNDLGMENKENNEKGDGIATTGEGLDEANQSVIITCEHCGHKSKSKGGHTRHLRKCKPDQFSLDTITSSKVNKIHRCENCDYTAPRRVLVINHMKIHGIFQCKRCKYRADSEEELDDHSATEHKDRSECKFCKVCNRYVKCNEIPLEKHKESCQGRVPFKCPECDKEFQYESSLKCHVVSHYPDKPKLFSCTQCEYKSNYKANLKKHIRHIHQQNKERNIKCPDCDKMFFSEDNMRRHIKLHSEERPFKCTETDCTKAFKTLNGLRSHAVTHTTEKLFVCHFDGCSKEFKTKKSLNYHIDDAHNMVPKTFICTVEGCDMAFHKKCHLDRHEASHSDEKKIPCSWPKCSKMFRTQDAMKIHLLRHTNEKPIRCEHCAYRCRQKSSLQFHMKKKHPDQIKALMSESEEPLKQESEDTIPATDSKPDCAEDQSGGEPKEKPVQNEETSGLEVNQKPVQKRTDLYEFQSEEESGDEMKPGLLRKEIDKDKPILPPVRNTVDLKLISDLDLDTEDAGDKTVEQESPGKKKKSKVKKKPGPKPKTEKEDGAASEEPVKPKKRGRKKKESLEEKEKIVEGEEKPKKRTGSPKGKKQKAEIVKESESSKPDEPGSPSKSPPKKGRKKKKVEQEQVENEVEDEEEKTKKKGRKKKKKENTEIKVENEEKEIKEKEEDEDEEKVALSDSCAVEETKVVEKEEVEENDDEKCDVEKPAVKMAEVEEETRNDLCDEVVHENEKVEKFNIVHVSDVSGHQDLPEDTLDRDSIRSNNLSDHFSSDLDTDFEEELKPPPAPRPPPMYDSEDGDIESGPENEDFNNSTLSNEPLRDFESSREISRDFESSREIEDSARNPSEANSVETCSGTPGGPASTNPASVNPASVNPASVNPASVNPSSVNPYKIDSVGKDTEGQDLPVSTPHPSQSSVPPTPTGNPEYEGHVSETPVEHTLIKHQAANDENTQSSMPEVDKDYVGRFFEEINCSSAPAEDPISRMNSIEDNNNKSQETIEEPSRRDDSGVPSSLTSSQTENSLQMQTPPTTDMSHKRMEILASDRQHEDHYQPRSDSANRPPDRIPGVYEQFTPLDPYSSTLPRDPLLRQNDSLLVPSSSASSFMRFPDSEAMLQRQRMATPYDRNIQNLHRITESALPQHSSASPLLRRTNPVAGREDMFSGTAPGVPGSMTRNPFHSSWSSQDVRPPSHWGHPTYIQRPLDQQSGSASSSLFKDNYLPGRDFMFDPSRGVAERNMFSSLSSSQTQPHDTFQFDRFDLGSYLSSHGYPASPSLPVDYTRGPHGSAPKSLDERYRQSTTGMTDFRPLPQSSSTDMFGSINMNSSFNLEKYVYQRDTMYHPQHITDNTNSAFLTHGVPGQHSVFGRDYPRTFYPQNTPYSFVNMNDKQYAASAKLTHGTSAMTQDRDLVTRPSTAAPESQIQDPYRHHSMLYNMMNRYFD